MTDLHIPPAGIYPHGQDARQNFVSVLDLIDRVHPIDMVVITGDLAHDTQDPSICLWIDSCLSSYEVPVYYTSGNHDAPEQLAKLGAYTGGLKDGELYYAFQEEDRMFIFLDTTHHAVSDKQLTWLASLLTACSQDHTHPYVFMHHPPCPSGSLFMDAQYPFKSSEAFAEVLQIYNDIVPVFCGHYHIAKTVMWKNASVLITPSTCFEIDPFRSEFTLEQAPPGLRVIDITDDILQSSVLRT